MTIRCSLINPNQVTVLLEEGPSHQFSAKLRAIGAEFSYRLKQYVIEIETIEYLREEGVNLKLDSAVRNELNRLNSQKLAWIEAGKDKTRGLKIKPFPHQIEDIGRIILDKSPATINCNPVGLGKTLEALATLNPTDSVLVTTTVSTKGVWKQQAEALGLSFKIEILSGRNQFRWPSPGEMLILNYDILPSIELLKKIGSPTSAVVAIFDEAHKLKNQSSKRSQMAEQVLNGSMTRLGVYSSGGRAMFLTGTPLENSPAELYELLRLAKKLPETLVSWSNTLRLFNAKETERGFEWGLPSLQTKARLKRSLIIHDKEKVLDLPDRIYSNIQLECTPEAKRALKSLEKELRTLGVEVDEAWAMADRGDQVADSVSEAFKLLAASKVSAIHDLVSTFEETGDIVIVASAHRAPIEILEKREGWASIHGGTKDRQSVVEDFQKGKYKGLAVTIQAAGEGLTLTRSCTMIFVDRHFNPAKNHQCEGRIYRIGAKNTCQYIDLCWDHPLEHRRAEIIGVKKVLFQETITSLTEMPEPDCEEFVYWKSQVRNLLPKMKEFSKEGKELLESTSKTFCKKKMLNIKEYLCRAFSDKLEGFGL